ncbi:MAG: 30S ribosomal protein S4 [Candidatus Margulisiibacteriota bacterium]
MARYRKAKCKLCRREGDKLFLRGDKCDTEKCPFSRRAYAPGQHGQARSKPSEYAIRLREKQKIQRIYGVSERQLRNYFDRASCMAGATGENFLRLLECRLDNVVYRMGILPSRSAARQFVRHGHIRVKGRRVDIPSYQAKEGDQVSVKDSARENLNKICPKIAEKTVPSWLSFNAEKFEGKILSLPSREQIGVNVAENLIVEFYSR